MNIIALARELGKAIQQEESYIKLHEVQDKADADTELQKYIGEFNLKRMQINDDATETVVNTKDGPQLLVEPQFVFRIGWERIKFSFNLSYAYLHEWKVNNDYFLYDPFSVAVGMHFKL